MSWQRLGRRAALFILLAVVIARVCTMETLRDAFAVAPGAEPVPRGTGPATSVVLDWIYCAIALLVLLCGRLRWTWSHLFFLSLAVLAMLSSIWADDKFAALVQGFHLIAAAAVFFAASQLCASWGKVRLIAAVSVGLLLIYAASGVYYRVVELPELREHWHKEKQQILHDRGWEENSFQARQFSQRIENGAMMGFNSSPNSFAAVIVLLAVVSIGLLIQRRVNGDALVLIIPIIVAVGVALVILYFTQSKAAFATLGLALLLLLAVIAPLRKQLAEHPARFFWVGVAIVLIGIVAIVGHGVYHHSLPGSSLNFRWKYWVASFHLFLTHPWLGVGWDNFGLHYLAFRLPEAPEEIKDPHNFFVRFCTELGLIGGLLLIAFLVAFWWKATRAKWPPTQDDDKIAALRYLAGLSVMALLVNILISIDLSQDSSFVYIEVVKRFLFFCLFLVGSVLAAIASTDRVDLDDRPAPWILYGLLIALEMFLVHNLIEFSLFEPGPMVLFAMLAGTALGARIGDEKISIQSTMARLIAAAPLSLALLAALVLLVIPVVRAEAAAEEGDENLRTGHFASAISDYFDAFKILPYNADYAMRCARAMMYAGDVQPSRVLDMLDKARRANPSNILTYLTRARYEMRKDPDSWSSDIEKSYTKALELNPNDVDARLEYAAALERLHKPAEALKQYRLALDYNDKLDLVEPKRLPADRLQAVQQNIARLTPH